MRVTGSMVIFFMELALLPEFHFRREIGHAAFDQFAEHKRDGLGGRRTAGNVQIHLDDFMYRDGLAQQRRHAVGRDAAVPCAPST